MAPSEVVKTFLEKTTLKGVKHAVSSQSTCLRAMWCVAVFAFLSISLLQVIFLLMEYFSYPSIVKIHEITHHQLGDKTHQTLADTFPTVTICNLNPLSSTRQKIPDTLNGIPTYEQYRKRVENLTRSTSFDILTSEMKEKLLSPYGYFSTIGIEGVKTAGHTWDELVLNCEFITVQDFFGSRASCKDHAIIQRHIQPDFFNCFTVSWNRSSMANDSPRGLAMIVHTGDVSESSTNPQGMLRGVNVDRAGREQDVGLILALDYPGRYPNIPFNSQRLSSGYHHDIGVITQIRSRLSRPYHDCENMALHHVLFDLTGNRFQFSRESHILACTQKHVWENCSCMDPDLPVSHVPTPLTQTKFCADLSTGDIGNVLANIRCMIEARKRVASQCIRESFLECDEFTLFKDISFNKWPRRSEQLSIYNEYINDSAIGMDPKFKSLRELLEEPNIFEQGHLPILNNITTIEDNFLKMTLVSRHLTLTALTDTPKYTRAAILSQIGGSLNLYAGVSLIFIFELFEMLYYCFHPVTKKAIDKEAQTCSIDNRLNLEMDTNDVIDH